MQGGLAKKNNGKRVKWSNRILSYYHESRNLYQVSTLSSNRYLQDRMTSYNLNYKRCEKNEHIISLRKLLF